VTGSQQPGAAGGIYQIVARRGRQCGVNVYPHRFRHHFSHTWLDRGGAERDLMELNGWTSPQMLTRYGASARGARARRSYEGTPGIDTGTPPRKTPAPAQTETMAITQVNYRTVLDPRL
jgi:integrase